MPVKKATRKRVTKSRPKRKSAMKKKKAAKKKKR